MGLDNDRKSDQTITICKQNISLEAPPETSNSSDLESYYCQLNQEFENNFLPYVTEQNYLQPQPSFQQLNAIQFASQKGYDRFLNKLELPKDAFNQATQYGFTPLHLAAAFGNLETVKVLLNKGADPTCLTNKGTSPIFNALVIPLIISSEIKQKKQEIFKLLKSQLSKEQLLIADDSGNTIAHALALGGFDNLVLELSTDPQLNNLLLIKNNNQHLPIHIAILNNKPTIVEILLRTTQIPCTQLLGRLNRTLLHYAIESGNQLMVEQCFNACPELTQIHDNNEETPYELAQRLQNHSATLFLKQHIPSKNHEYKPVNNSQPK